MTTGGEIFDDKIIPILHSRRVRSSISMLAPVCLNENGLHLVRFEKFQILKLKRINTFHILMFQY